MAKLVEILARELKEWPEEAVAIAQDLDACAHPYDSALLEFNHGEWGGKEAEVQVSSFNVRMPERASDYSTTIVTRAEWQAAVDGLNKPDVVEWDGEGLPPVGAVCEFQNSLGSWFQVEITAIAKKGICFVQADRDGENYVCQVSSKFRPARTPEQIAAEEREKTAYIMMVDAGVDDNEWSRQLCLALYDAGYRKQEQK